VIVFSPEEVFTVLVSTVKLSFGKSKGSLVWPPAVIQAREHAAVNANEIIIFLIIELSIKEIYKLRQIGNRFYSVYCNINEGGVEFMDQDSVPLWEGGIRRIPPYGRVNKLYT
jgi:hypothetical protein